VVVNDSGSRLISASARYEVNPGALALTGRIRYDTLAMIYRSVTIPSLPLLVLSFLLAGHDAMAADRGGYDAQGIVLHATPRTVDQTAAFYSGRGFPPAMIGRFTDVCFITVGMRHTRDDVVWLEPARWRVRDAHGGAVTRLDRAYWDRQWDALAAPRASRATFGWTLLPESRDMQPGESVGGNITVRRPVGPLSIEFHFLTGKSKDGTDVVARIDGLLCQEANENETEVQGGQP
jgi:hypothetical protein